ncbi:AfsR/SARP family transcriptional regulator [Dictyobacter formicarum]|uniref:Bacterial transcriptional activator domain-containing protein n=1 Tax=Dictyobacter formicarum TaxID=2778368 RepID=A0ABQ3V958_9CHLR|nr:BTAD domain-containing putative transcriptional regulator [Dictyobacter formicarum]GHO82363.1 hypothetical protein KSZ_03690 [Dictyobacter formicarum]
MGDVQYERYERNVLGSPLVRIWLCGACTVEWMDPVTGEALSKADLSGRGRDHAAALSLLKLLLCQPQRRAHRDWIMEQFWPENGRNAAAHRLENIFSVLRKMVCHPVTGESLLRSFRAGKENGMIYQLAEAPQLWLDVDALIWNVEQAARMERFGDDAQPFWERAYALGKRGVFLPDDRYVDWAVQRRNEVEGYYRQTVHALAHLFLSRYGTAGASEALLLLRTYWQQHPKDEDALRLLMQILIQQDRYQEALGYYDQLCSILQEDGVLPDERTKDSAEYCKVKQIQYGSVDYPISGKQCQQQILSSSFTRAVQDNLEIPHVLDGAFPLNTSRRTMLQNFIGWMGATALSPMVSVDVNALCSFNPSELRGATKSLVEVLY